MKKRFLFIFISVITLLFTIQIVTAEEVYNTSQNVPITINNDTVFENYDYVIDSYNLDMTVNANNTFNITEDIETIFNYPKHGIFRSLPLKNSILREDGTTAKNRVKISKVSVDNKFTTYKENGNYVIKIGSANSVVTGTHKYNIKYNYNIGKDPSKDYDELYFNLVGPEWDTVIRNFTFTIHMPKEFDASKLGFTSGTYGSNNTDNVTYEIVGNDIIGSYNGVIYPKNAFTVRLELPEGYFVGASSTADPILYFMFMIPMSILIISFFLWYMYGKDNPIVETVEFYPPEGFNSLEVAFFYKGAATKKDVVSLLVYLANKGYLKIEEQNGILQKGFKLTKLKEYDGDNENEKIFFNDLFSQAAYTGNLLKLLQNNGHIMDSEETTNIRNEVSSSDLVDTFYLTINKILHNVNRKENKKIIFEKSSIFHSVIVYILMAISWLSILMLPTLEFGTSDLVITSAFVGLMYLPFFSSFAFNRNMPAFSRIFIGVFVTIHCFMFVQALPIGEALKSDTSYLVAAIFGFICTVGTGIIFNFMPKRTKYGNEMLGKLHGFKNFLKTAEKEQLEALVLENPEYFYNILPYTYVLGVSDKWIKKFETITLEPPTWYGSSDPFTVATFGTFMNNTMRSANYAMTSSPSSSGSGGGGSSGGGCSGGGSGGGGGGSW